MDDNQKTIQKYNELLEKHGDSPKSLGWTKDKEYLRFKILCSQFDLEGSSILDFGCGLGYLYAYLKQNYKNFNYIGIDINQNLLEIAKNKYPEATFKCLDLLNDSIEYVPDFILSSGVHNIKMSDNEEFNKKTFFKFKSLAKKGFAINFLSDKVDYLTAGSYHNSPEKVLTLAYQHSRRIALRNDYMPFEFTVFVDLRNEFDENAVFKDFSSTIKPINSW